MNIWVWIFNDDNQIDDDNPKKPDPPSVSCAATARRSCPWRSAPRRPKGRWQNGGRRRPMKYGRFYRDCKEFQVIDR